MASISPVSRNSDFSLDRERPDIESIRAIVSSVNEYILELMVDAESWNSLKSRCISRLNILRQELIEISEHSVLSNLYWGIQSIEAAIGVECSEERGNRLRNAERMLQVSALLDEHGVTAGIQNHYLVSCSYFYLSVICKLQSDDLQVALHFLQATLVSTRLFLVEFSAPGLCRILFPSSTLSEMDELPSDDEVVRQTVRKYKHWLMYYQIMSLGETPQRHCRTRDTSNASNEPKYNLQEGAGSSNYSKSVKQRDCLRGPLQHEMVHPLGIINDAAIEPKVCRDIQEIHNRNESLRMPVQVIEPEKCASKKSLQEALMEDQSDTPTSVSSSYSYYPEESDLEANMDDTKSSIRLRRTNEDYVQAEVCVQKLKAPHSTLDSMCNMIVVPHAPQLPLLKEGDKEDITCFFSDRFFGSISDPDFSNSELGNEKSDYNLSAEDHSDQMQLKLYTSQFIDQAAVAAHQQRHIRVASENSELMSILEKAISKLCFSEGLANCEQDYVVEVVTIYKMLSEKKGIKYAMLRDMILDQLLAAISNSKEEKVIRASVSILTTIISVNRSAVEDVKKKGLRLLDLATALKRNVHEAAILIYLINPSPVEIKTLELLPALVEVVCASNSHKEKIASLLVTPPAASLMIIEVLITSFDYATNNIHLEAISSPRVLYALLDVAKSSNLEESISLANILVKCMQFDGQCRKHILRTDSIAPFTCLLESKEKHAKFIALEFFHEILHLPRSSAITILQRIAKEGSTDIMQVLAHCVRKLQPNYQLLAADLLLQLDILESSSGRSVSGKEAIEVIFKSLASKVGSTTQQLSAFILANIGGTYSWTGEPYTVAWLVKKAGLTSLHHRNLIKNIDWLDQNPQDAVIDSWSSKIARGIIDEGATVFQALAEGLRCKTKTISRDCLTAVACIGCEIAKYPNRLRSTACDILLPALEQFLHPGSELEERLLACLCIYNYASGRGMQKLVHFSEGVRESMRRFSSVTWMAEELHRVAEFYLPNQSRISCVHTQILEANSNNCGAVTALIYYRGLLCSGYSDGSIKLWDINQQSAKLVWDMREHKKAVTCFSLLEAREHLLSGSADKTIRVWKMVQRKLDCTEVIAIKEPIRKLETCGEMILVLTESHRMKMLDSLRKVQDFSNNRKVKCMSVVRGKIYTGCADSSIQELGIRCNKEREIKAPTKGWRMQNKAINSVVVYKDWLYSGSSIVEGSKLKEWRSNSKPQMSVLTQKAGNILAMEVVEDFIYLNCSSSTSTLQIWLRGTQQKVGRISAGSRITSLLTANDIVLCGTEKGLIKGWIPL